MIIELTIAVLASSAMLAHLVAIEKANARFNDVVVRNVALDKPHCDMATEASGAEPTGRFFACREGWYKGVQFTYHHVSDTQKQANDLLANEMRSFCACVDSHFGDV